MGASSGPGLVSAEALAAEGANRHLMESDHGGGARSDA
jgi:hypothetical protein